MLLTSVTIKKNCDRYMIIKTFALTFGQFEYEHEVYLKAKKKGLDS